MKIVTSFIFPPIPIRDFDWQATTDNYDCSWEGEETGWVGNEPIGYGATEAEAVADLMAKLDEESSDADWKDRELGQSEPYVDPHEDYADSVCIPLHGEIK